MNILNIAHLYKGGDFGDAAAIRTNFIMKGLRHHGNEVTTLSYAVPNEKCNKNSEFEYLVNLKCTSFYIKVLIKIFLMPLFLSVYLFSNRAQFDVIFVDRLPFYLALPLAFLKYLLKLKVIWVVNEFPATYSGQISSRFGVFIESFCFKAMGKVSSLAIVISQKHELVYKKICNKSCLFLVIPILMDVSCKKMVPLQTSKLTKITYAGALSKSNGIDFLLDVCIELMLTTNRFTFILFGPWISEQYRIQVGEKIKKNNLSDYVTILPAVSNDKAIVYLNSSDILVIPKIEDARSIGYIPSKLGDFLFTGKPVVVTDVGDVPNYVVDGINGFIVPPGNVKLFSKRLAVLIEDYPNYSSIGCEGINTAKAFDYIKQTEKINNKIISMALLE